MIKFIDVNNIYNHPDNPRKDLGDLTELAESIKQSGILQNLTIVPIADGKEDAEYYAVIGNRRLAAAKLAGLTEVPCAVSDMDHKTQIATMLLENMQRSDLTVYEQAQGFQMMLNLGESIADISDKTGFSESTVRRRTKLLELDQDKLKESAQRGATLMDYMELEKIEDLKIRNEVLEKIGTQNFQWALKRAVDEQEKKKRLNEIILELEKFATEVEDTHGLSYKEGYYGSPNDKVMIPEDIREVEYFYKVQHGYAYLYYEKAQTEEESREDGERKKEEELRKKRQSELKEVSRRAYELRKDFVRNLSNAKAKNGLKFVIENAIYAMFELNSYRNYEDLAGFFDMSTENEDGLKINDIAEQIHKQAEKFLLVSVYVIFDGEDETYFNYYYAEHRGNEDLDRLYELLKTLGYEMSQEEIELQNGTHKLFLESDR